MIDKQTLAWINKSKYWIKRLKPNFKEPRRGGGISENAYLPDTMTPIQYNYFNMITNRKEITFTNYWGFEKWHHSLHLINNNCKCPRCNFDGKNDKWWFMPMEFWDNV